MDLVFEKDFDGRKLNHIDIIDRETGNVVGHLRSGGGNSGGIHVSLFGDKYRRTFNRGEECWAFMKGVESVLNHMTRIETPAWAQRLVESSHNAA